MDIGELSIGMSQSSLSKQVSTALYKKILNTTKDNGQNLINNMKLSINPNIGNNLDKRA